MIEGTGARIGWVNVTTSIAWCYYRRRLMRALCRFASPPLCRSTILGIEVQGEDGPLSLAW